MNITISEDEMDRVVIQSLTEDYSACYHETGEDGELVRLTSFEDELMIPLKRVIFYYLNSDQRKEFNKRFPLCP